VTTGLTAPTQYFPKNALLNKMGYNAIDEVMQRGTQALSPTAFEAAANEENAPVLDVRDAQDFAGGFVPNAINIGLNGQFASWVGTLVTDLRQPLLLIAPEGKEEEAVLRLARVGYDNCIGYLKVVLMPGRTAVGRSRQFAWCWQRRLLIGLLTTLPCPFSMFGVKVSSMPNTSLA